MKSKHNIEWVWFNFSLIFWFLYLLKLLSTDGILYNVYIGGILYNKEKNKKTKKKKERGSPWKIAMIFSSTEETKIYNKESNHHNHIPCFFFAFSKIINCCWTFFLEFFNSTTMGRPAQPTQHCCARPITLHCGWNPFLFWKFFFCPI